MLLYLKIKPNQRFDRVERIEDLYQVRLKAPAIDGKANGHLIKFLSEILKIPKSKIQLLKGHTARLKCVEIDAGESYVKECLEKQCEGLHNTL